MLTRWRRNSARQAPVGKAGRRGIGKAGVRGRVGKALACIAFFGVLCVLPVFVNSALGYVPVLAYVLLLALSFAYPRLLARKLKFDLLVERSSCVRDTDVKLVVRFANPLPIACPRVDADFHVTDIFGADDVSTRFSFSLGPGKSRDFDFSVRFAHIGTVGVGLSLIVAYDPFGLFGCALPASDDVEVEVLPHIFEVDSSLSRTLRLRESTLAVTPFNRDGMDYMGVREYVYGDPLKAVHWKLYSHAGVLYTRLYEDVGEPVIDVLCATSFAKCDSQALMSLYDAQLEVVLSLLQFGEARHLHMKASFREEGGGILTMEAPEALAASTGLVKRFPLPSAEGGPDELPQLVRDRALDSRAGGNLVVCTTQMSTALVHALAAAAARQVRILLFFVVRQGLGNAERRELVRPLRRFEGTSVSCYMLAEASELEAISYE